MHSCLADTFFHIAETLDVSICKHRNAHSFSIPVNRTDVQNWELESAQKFCSCRTNLIALLCHHTLRVCRNPPRLVLLTNLTAWMCSHDATPASGPFCSLVRPCTVSSCNTTVHLLLTCTNPGTNPLTKKFLSPYMLRGCHRVPTAISAGTLASQKLLSSIFPTARSWASFSLLLHGATRMYLQISYCVGFHL